MNLDRTRVGAAVALALVSVQPVEAATTGHVGVFSEYMFRGIVANGGAAVQGGIDHLTDRGLLAGIWVSNADTFGGSELDVYAGYLHKVNDTLTVDVGALYYFLTEDKEAETTPDGRDQDMLELFATAYVGPVKLQMYWSPDYLGQREGAYYYTGTYTHTLKRTLTLAAQIGYTHGDGAEMVYGEKYVDYSLTLSKALPDGIVFSLAAIDTDLSGNGFLFPNTDDDPKILVSAKKTFPF